MKKLIVMLIFFSVYADAMDDHDCKAVGLELAELIESAAEHTLEEFTHNCMWKPKYKNMTPAQFRLVKAHAKKELARRLLTSSTEELKRAKEEFFATREKMDASTDSFTSASTSFDWSSPYSSSDAVSKSSLQTTGMVYPPDAQ